MGNCNPARPGEGMSGQGRRQLRGTPGGSATLDHRAWPGLADPKTHWQRKAERRREKLEKMRQQVEAGILTVRQMTPAERKRHPAPARPVPKRSIPRYRP